MYIALDLETTGLNAQKDKIIEIAAIKIEPDGTILDVLHYVIDPQIKIPQIITHITGITDEEVQGKPKLEDLKAEIIEFIGNYPILGHSIQFDIDFLNANGMAEGAIPLDTFQLAKALLPKEASYSLEILSEKYNLPHPNKHRADDDTKVAIELYKMLLQRIREIPEHRAEQIKNLLSKSDWTWKESFLNFLGESPQQRKVEKSEDLTPGEPGSEKLQQQLFENLTTNRNAIIESPDYKPTDLAMAALHMSEQTGEHVVIVTPHPEKIVASAGIAHLEHPARYLNLNEFNKFFEKDHFTDAETRLAIKVLLWLDHTHTGMKDEISLKDEEQSVWSSVSEIHSMFSNKEPDPESFYGKAFKHAKYTPVLVVHPSVLLENMVRKATLVPPKAHLVIENIEEFEGAAFHSLTNLFALNQFSNGLPESLASSFAILFGLFGIILEKHASEEPGNAYGGSQQLTLKPHHMTGNEGVKILATLDNIKSQIDTTSPFIQNHFVALMKALTIKPHVRTWIDLTMRGDVLIKACPENPNKLLKKMLWDQFQTINAITAFGSLDFNFKYIKDRLYLDPSMEEIDLPSESSAPLVPLMLYPNLPNVKVPANNTETSKVIQAVLDNHNQDKAVFLLTNSVKAAEQLHEKILDPLKEAGWNVLTQGIGGGLGKLSQKFEGHHSQTILIGTERLLNKVLESPTAKQIDTLFVHRIPFKYPFHPVLKHQTEQMENGFIEHSVPVATLALKKVLYNFSNHCSPAEIHVLDPRIENYNQVFMSAFTSFAEVSI
jgi:DNA polymerase III epsilon subunit family exonuclease